MKILDYILIIGPDFHFPSTDPHPEIGVGVEVRTPLVAAGYGGEGVGLIINNNNMSRGYYLI